MPKPASELHSEKLEGSVCLGRYPHLYLYCNAVIQGGVLERQEDRAQFKYKPMFHRGLSSFKLLC